MSHVEPRIIPPHNLFGDHGPRCRGCSGWGAVFRPPRVSRLGILGPARKPSPCEPCQGTGIEYDPLLMRASERERAFYRALEIGTSYLPPTPMNSRQSWSELIAWTTVDGTAVANTTTEAIIFPDVTIPSNFMQYGRTLRITAGGKLSTTATPTMVWALRWGGVAGTLIANTELLTTATGSANVNWRLQGELQNRTDGALGTLIFQGTITMNLTASTSITQVFGVSGFDAPAAVTANLTADTALSITADWSAASASNTLLGLTYFIEALN